MTEIDDTNDISLTASDDFAGNIYESATVKAFRGFTNVPAETIRKIRESDDIRQSDLAALSDDDLKLFGIEDAMLRREMLTRFSTLPNQSLHYDEYDFTKYLEVMEADSYRQVAYKNIINQLHLINKVIEVSQTTLHSNPIVYDKLVNDTVHVSTLNIKAIQELLKTVRRITNTTDSRWNIWAWTIGGAAVLASLFCLRKILR